MGFEKSMGPHAVKLYTVEALNQLVLFRERARWQGRILHRRNRGENVRRQSRESRQEGQIAHGSSHGLKRRGCEV
jgi:hypothetical protein